MLQRSYKFRKYHGSWISKATKRVEISDVEVEKMARDYFPSEFSSELRLLSGVVRSEQKTISEENVRLSVVLTRSETETDITGSLWKRGSPLFMEGSTVHAYEYGITEKIPVCCSIVHLRRDKLIQFAS